MDFQKTLNAWIDALDEYSEEEFLEKPSENSWSIGQVYVHLMLSNDHFFMKQAEKCLNGEDVKTGVKKKWAGRLVFFKGGFPEIRIPMPKSVAVTPRQPESIARVCEKLKRSGEIAASVEKRLPRYDPRLKTKHPALGYLNAKEWYEANEMHFRHHLRQKERIVKYLEEKKSNASHAEAR